MTNNSMQVGDRVCLSNYESVRGFVESIDGNVATIRLDSGYSIIVTINSLEKVILYTAHSVDWLKSLDPCDSRKPRLE